MNSGTCQKIIENISKTVVGKNDSLELLLTALISGGHVLLEDVPGVGKTLTAKSLSKSINCTYKRIQFTPDILPGDITGFNIFDQKTGDFKFEKGPVMTNILLADEINRAIPRTQSSLLESMEEYQVTVDSVSYKLPSPFMVIATQNPIELEGTFPLPEAQLDRFLMKISLGYPDRSEEKKILERFQNKDPFLSLTPVVNAEDIINLKSRREEIMISSEIIKYIIDITSATREHEKIKFGASPRGSLSLMYSCQSLALIRERSYVLPDDVKELAGPVLAHRIIPHERALLSGIKSEDLINEITAETAVPSAVCE